MIDPPRQQFRLGVGAQKVEGGVDPGLETKIDPAFVRKYELTDTTLRISYLNTSGATTAIASFTRMLEKWDQRGNKNVVTNRRRQSARPVGLATAGSGRRREAHRAAAQTRDLADREQQVRRPPFVVGVPLVDDSTAAPSASPCPRL